MKFPNQIFTILMLVAFVMSSCEEDSEETVNSANGETAMQTDQIIVDAMASANDGADGSDDGVSNGRTKACATITNDAASKVLTIDFGTAGCAGRDGRTRKGKIKVQYQGLNAQSSTSRTLIYESYSVNGNVLSGTLTMSGVSRPTSTSLSYSVSASNISLTLANGRSFSVTAFQRSFAYNFGIIQNLGDDVLTITGSSTQVSAEGNETSMEITSPVTIKSSCVQSGLFYPVSGKYQIVDGRLTYTIDWGTDACDNTITITALGKTTTKELPGL